MQNCSSAEQQKLFRWKDCVVGLGRPGHFTVTRELKTLIRRGVPTNLRGAVWRAVVSNRVLQTLPQPLLYCKVLCR